MDSCPQYVVKLKIWDSTYFPASIFAYGQTSSGKTYTMTGITEYSVSEIYDYIYKVHCLSIQFKRVYHVLNLTICILFIYFNGCPLSLLWQHSEREFVLKFSAIEIYNEAVKDLLNPDSGQLRLLDDPEVGILFNILNDL